ncbi:hypothetical protein BH24ACT20_BH24ACT20_03490 [soil metagenome]
MQSYGYRIGETVQVGDRHSREHLRGQVGTIKEGFGHPHHPALNVLLEDGREELFWHYELEYGPGGAAGRDSA